MELDSSRRVELDDYVGVSDSEHSYTTNRLESDEVASARTRYPAKHLLLQH